METAEFPTATFVLTEPIDFGQVPPEGEQITATATGDLTLHGVTRSVTFEVTAQIENGRVGVLGNIPVLFADYEIDNPSFGPVGDRGQRPARDPPDLRPRLLTPVPRLVLWKIRGAERYESSTETWGRGRGDRWGSIALLSMHC